jgi:hypothetical protein
MKNKIEANFLQFISGMAAQTMMHLWMMENPISRKTSLDLPNAKYSIDLLGIIQDKTNGNLTPEEDNYLSAALKDLRVRYAQAAEKAGQE